MQNGAIYGPFNKQGKAAAQLGYVSFDIKTREITGACLKVYAKEKMAVEVWLDAEKKLEGIVTQEDDKFYVR